MTLRGFILFWRQIQRREKATFLFHLAAICTILIRTAICRHFRPDCSKRKYDHSVHYHQDRESRAQYQFTIARAKANSICGWESIIFYCGK